MNAVTTYQPANAVTVYNHAFRDAVTVQRARNPGEIIERVRDASACVADIRLLLKVIGPRLNLQDLKVVAYALARARYREDQPIDLDQLAMLCETTRDKAAHYLAKVCGLGADATAISPDQVSAVLSNIADYS